MHVQPPMSIGYLARISQGVEKSGRILLNVTSSCNVLSDRYSFVLSEYLKITLNL